MSKAATVFMFSGQGSQYFKMAGELFDTNRVFRQQMMVLDALAQDLSSASVIEALYSTGRKVDPFDRTRLTHPAIFMVEYSLAHTLIDAGLTPDYVLGASLGSFAAAAVAGFLSVEDALAGVVRQAAAFEEFCEPGGMLAILAEPSVFSEDFLIDHSELAGVSSPSHFVVSAKRAKFSQIEATLRLRNVAHQRLPVSFAFHSQWIDDAQTAFQAFMKSIRSARAQLPLICCERAEIRSTLPEDYFWRIVRRPIRFPDAIAQLEQAGAHRYIDVGPAGTLATFLKYGLPPASRSTAHAILTPYGHDQKNLAAVLASRLN